jgi:hypothetical protein
MFLLLKSSEVVGQLSAKCVDGISKHKNFDVLYVLVV